eukprot:1192014-Prorocentrum_minimum.AAC.1
MAVSSERHSSSAPLERSLAPPSRPNERECRTYLGGVTARPRLEPRRPVGRYKGQGHQVIQGRGPRQGWSTGHKAPRWAAGETGSPRPTTN